MDERQAGMALIRGWYPVLVGVYLGLLQTGYFFQLTLMLSSGFTTYLMVTLCWLAGSAAGAGYLHRRAIGLKLLLVAGLLTYGICAALVMALPFNTSLWLVYAALVFVTGIFPGVFFARLSQVYPAGTLFFRENNGFLIGLVLGTLLFMLQGRATLWVMPVICGALLLVMPVPETPTPSLPPPQAGEGASWDG
jgi:hypothetical protein